MNRDREALLARYTLLGGRVAVPTLGLYLRTWVGVLVWLALPSLAARLLGRLGHRSALHGLARWWAPRFTRFLRIRLDVAGLEHVQPSRKYVVVSLHEGFADGLALMHLPLDLRFVARDELFGWPWLGGVLRDTRQIEVCPERGATAYRHLRQQVPSCLASTESVVVFPQGSILGIETDFSRGAFALAQALGLPLLPVAVTGGHRVWEHPFSPRLRYDCHMSLRVLPPVEPDDLRTHGVEAVRVEVRNQLKAQALSVLMASPRRFVPSLDGFWDGYSYRIDPSFPDLAAEVQARRQAMGATRSARAGAAGAV